MIYDTFIFFNELDLLDLRLHELNGVVDKFVLCESIMTHSGKPKPLYYDENKARFKEFHDKIIHVIVSDPPLGENPWLRERYQRNAIVHGLDGCRSDDIVMLSDVDEIPRSSKIAEIVDGKYNVFSQQFHFYYMNVERHDRPPWYGTRAVKMSMIDTLQQIRDHNTEEDLNRIADGGWHYSYLGGTKAIQEKLLAFAHCREYGVAPYIDLEYIRDRVARGRDLYDRNETWITVPVDATFPQYVLSHPEIYQKYIIHEGEEIK